MDDGELVSTPLDKNIRGMQRHRSGRDGGPRPRRPMLWDAIDVEDTGNDLFGRFPVLFLEFAYRALHLGGSTRILHVCSGGLEPGTRGVRVDLRPQAKPDVVADGRALPFADESFDAVLIDPPWSREYAAQLYGTDYPRPSALLSEASRVVRPGRFVGMMHFLVPKAEGHLKFVRVIGITTGVGYRIRALTIYQKQHRGLFQ